jgi:hypothetical protein
MDHAWLGEPYPAEGFRNDAGVLGGVGLLGDGGPEHLHAVAPWGGRVAVETQAIGAPFRTLSTARAHRDA